MPTELEKNASSPYPKSWRATSTRCCSVASAGFTATRTNTSWHTPHSAWGGAGANVVNTRVARRARLMTRSASHRSASTCRACIVTRPATMAFVVAIAGIMLPAICFVSKRVCSWMPYTWARRFAAAVTKPRASSSSLSNDCGASMARFAKASAQSRNSSAFSRSVKGRRSRSVGTDESAAVSGSACVA